VDMAAHFKWSITMTDMDPNNPAYDSYAQGITDAGQIS